MPKAGAISEKLVIRCIRSVNQGAEQGIKKGPVSGAFHIQMSSISVVQIGQEVSDLALKFLSQRATHDV